MFDFLKELSDIAETAAASKILLPWSKDLEKHVFAAFLCSLVKNYCEANELIAVKLMEKAPEAMKRSEEEPAEEKED